MTSGYDPAFPTMPSRLDYPFYSEYKKAQDGLTKREFFAAYFMQGVVTATPDISEEEAARIAVERADALLEALR